MRALRAHSRGGPEVLVAEEAPVPWPGAGEVQVAVDAAAVTFDELLWDETWAHGTPVIPSHELAGTVSAVGDGVDLPVGTAVFGMVPFDRDGAAAEWVVTPAAQVAPAPGSLSAVEAAALPLAGLTALQALVDHAGLQRGEAVLVLGGTGGVGSYAVQLARHLGGRVTATVRRDADFARTLGAHEVVDVSRPEDSLTLASYDVVVDTVGGTALAAAYSLVRPGGRLVTLQAPPDRAAAAEAGIDATFFVVSADAGGLAELRRLADAGVLRAPIAATFPLADGRAAYESGARPGRRPGKTVLVVR
jgi:NADPH:quinone reductase-like Zn-dependent oxidoreductase